LSGLRSGVYMVQVAGGLPRKVVRH
jgi:hypothetical protein